MLCLFIAASYNRNVMYFIEIHEYPSIFAAVQTILNGHPYLRLFRSSEPMPAYSIHQIRTDAYSQFILPYRFVTARISSFSSSESSLRVSLHLQLIPTVDGLLMRHVLSYPR